MSVDAISGEERSVSAFRRGSARKEKTSPRPAVGTNATCRAIFGDQMPVENVHNSFSSGVSAKRTRYEVAKCGPGGSDAHMGTGFSGSNPLPAGEGGG